MARRSGLREEGRSFGGGDINSAEATALKSLITGGGEDELVDRVGLEDAAMTSSAGASLNSYLRLLMNLMNAYRDGSESDLQCLWRAYCVQLNDQASVSSSSAGGVMGGWGGTVARINSVGMRVMLDLLPPRHAAVEVAKAMMDWQDVRCQEMFPLCQKDVGGGSDEER